jgi:cobalt-zinc-cadmium efflux system protein
MHNHTHEPGEQVSDLRLLAAIAFNMVLTAVEIVGGVVAGSLALVADALHNFNDCASLLIALIARRVSQKQADELRTFGYRRAEVVGALINLTILILVSLYLLGEAVWRFFQPQQIEGWTVLVIATIALIVDVATVGLLYSMSKGSLNVRAAFLHNLTDALASVGVILVAVAVLLWNFYLADLIITIAIAGYILWQSFPMMSKSVAILMESVPKDLDLAQLVADIRQLDGVLDLHHVHIWELDEHHRAMEAHVVVPPGDCEEMERTKQSIKKRLQETFRIAHSTLELEPPTKPGEISSDDTSLIPKH